MTPKEYAKSLRLIAEWYEHQTDGVPVPETDLIACIYGQDHKAQAAQALELSKALGDCEKEYASGGYFFLRRMFGSIRFSFLFNREAICTRRVVAKKETPGYWVLPHIEEVVEWDCHPILKPSTKP